MTSPYGVVSVYCHADCAGSQRRQGQIRGFHRGVDLAAAAGTPVAAANDGIVRLAETLPLSGKAVLLDHGMGIVTSYLHQSAILVRPGQRVRRGEIIGRVGSTGLSTGPHLHWGLRINGVHVDPMPWTR
ncbi:MAG: M23 family metallopeptidase [bacterium]